MRKFISRKDIFEQLKSDLIGKDAHRGITLTYAWMANQFGHFALGFIPTFIIYTVLTKYYSGNNVALWSAVIISGAWLLFEIYNFLGPLLKNKHSKSKLLFVAGETYIFKPAWGNIAFDTATDLIFFWLGAFVASLLCQYSVAALVIIVITFLAVIYPAHYWFLTKMYLQIPKYPLQFRLSQWEFAIAEYEKKIVYNFLQSKEQAMHLLVFGSKGSGKTSLSVAMATELSIKHHACTYTTAMKLYCMFFESVQQSATDSLWDWRAAEVLIIDDINPGDPIEDNIVSPEVFLKFLDAGSTTNTANRKLLKNKKVVWVLGNEYVGAEALGTWLAMLQNIGVERKKIHSINLRPGSIIQ
jgi:hypothetical protein